MVWQILKISRIYIVRAAVLFLMVGVWCTTFANENFISGPPIQSFDELGSTLSKAIRETWQIDNRHLRWSSSELQQFEAATGKKLEDTHRFVWGTVGAEKSRVLRISFYDSFCASKFGQVILYLDRPPPQETIRNLQLAGLKAAGLDLLLNGVRFRPKDRDVFEREVYLGDRPNLGDLSDRLRLAVNDNRVLNPWHRLKDLELRKSFAQQDREVALSSPQEEAVQFLKELRSQNQLKGGGLIQIPTGMGKTEAMFKFYADLKISKPVRMLWMVDSFDLPESTRLRYDRHFNSSGTTLTWRGQSLDRESRTQIAHGKVQELFASMDSLKSDRSKNLLKSWIELDRQAPVLIVMDEGQGIGAVTHRDLFEWLWNNFSDRVEGRVGLSATPVHYLEGEVSRFFGNHAYYALTNARDIDPETGLHQISFLAQLIRAARKGYVAIPLLYGLGDFDMGEAEKDRNQYSLAELSRIGETLEAFRPFKGLLFHSAGQNDEFGSAGRMKQFSKVYGETSHAPSLSMSGKDSAAQRESVQKRFNATSEGVLSLTLVGSQGLDLPDVNFVGLLANSKSQVLINQRIGRGVRLAPGKPVSRIVDFSGQNLSVAFEDLSSILGGRSMSSRRARLLKLIARAKSETYDPKVASEFYEVLGVDPALVGADKKAFETLLINLKSQIFGRVRYQVHLHAAAKAGIDLDSPEEGESLTAYLRRHLADWREAGLLAPFGEVKARVAPLFSLEGETEDSGNVSGLSGLWNRALDTHWATKKGRYHWQVDQGTALKLEMNLPVIRVDEKLGTYLKANLQKFVERGLNKPLGQVWGKVESLFTSESGSDDDARYDSLKGIWNQAFRSTYLQPEDGWTWQPDLEEAARRGVALTAPGRKEALFNYIKRHRTAFAAAGLIKPFGEVKGSVLSLFIFQGMPDSKKSAMTLRGLWSGAFRKDYPPARILSVWSVNFYRAAELGLNLLPQKPGEGLSNYLKRNQAAFDSAGMLLSFAKVRDRLRQVIALAAVQAGMDVPVTVLRSAWNNAFARAGGIKRTRAVYQWRPNFDEFKKHGLAFAERANGETLGGYLTRNLKLFEQAGYLLPYGQVKDRLTPLFEFWSEKGETLPPQSPLIKSWDTFYRSANRKRLTSAAPADRNWPQSNTLKNELPRLHLLHLAVAKQYLSRLENDADRHIYFMGRDADDFYYVLRQLVYVQNIPPARKREMNLRIHRLNLSRSLLMGNPTNPKQISKLSTAEIAQILESQGLKADQVGHQKIDIFDIGFEGHVIRPILATLLESSRLEPEEFFKKVDARFLLSKPERVPSLTGKVERDIDALGFFQALHQQRESESDRQIKQFQAAHDVNPEAAIAKYLRSYGELTLRELDLAAIFKELIAERVMTKPELIQVLERPGSRLLTDPEQFRRWLESFVEGKGLQVVPSESEEDNDKLRSDLGRSNGRIRTIKVGVGSEPVYTYEPHHSTEAKINSEAEYRRHQTICGHVLSKLALSK